MIGSILFGNIADQIKCFSVESTSLKRIVLAGNYPNLHQLDIFIINDEAELPFNGKISRRKLFPSNPIQYNDRCRSRSIISN